LLVGSLVSGLATLTFRLFADGLISALLIWAIAGMGFAGAYMQGLKALTDRLGKMELSRSVTLYTACFSLGVALSFLVAQLVANRWGWQAAFYLTADSGALTSGMTASAEPAFRGATMALHSMIGFGLSVVVGSVAGVAIDIGGGITAASGWIAAFLVMAAGGLLGPVALWWSERPLKQNRLSPGG
jgi:MFS family permease